MFPADDAHAPVWRGLAGTRPMLTFALQGAADVTAEATWGEATSGAVAAHARRERERAGCASPAGTT